MSKASPEIEWTDGVPVARAFDDPYFSKRDGLAEARHVFLDGNGLPARFRPGFHIAELGFGTGLNALAALDAWRKAGCDGPLRFTSFELFPLRATDAMRALEAFPDVADLAAPILSALEGDCVVQTDDLHLTLIIGDARETLLEWQDQADAWFLDGFAPARNPELWEPELLSHVARHTTPEGSFATYTAAGAVRRALSEAGFEVERVPGFGSKRHMTKGRLA
ncbi:MAG: tRNA (5-methylaminomethyl-2-thiouridine)(34)-methyltransferase MnmD [Silicimonas sp.]|nr:tRNA (5-methylaminomethyl-2-thiouridine)(34)-methyltransferase MnmD [Silicimonas sp.]